MLTTYTFQGYKGRAEHRFTCPSCGKQNRVRTFTEEHRVNPFNKNPDGTVRTPTEVRANAYAAAKQARDKFATAPLCATCENVLDYEGRKAIRAERDRLFGENA